MTNVWPVVKWEVLVVLAGYIVVQVLASRRLKGERRNQSHRVAMVILVCTMVQSWVHDVFENPNASAFAMLALGACASVATVVLTRMMADQKLELKRL